jgi:hypothetical protein
MNTRYVPLASRYLSTIFSLRSLILEVEGHAAVYKNGMLTYVYYCDEYYKSYLFSVIISEPGTVYELGRSRIPFSYTTNNISLTVQWCFR